MSRHQNVLSKGGVAAIVVALICNLWIGPSFAAEPLATSTPKAISGNADLAIPQAEIEALSEQALGGSIDAAWRLALHFEFVAYDNTAAVRWYSIGAENGSTKAMYSLGSMLLRQPDRASRIRAEYWLKRVIALGEQPIAQYATDLLNEPQ